MPVKRTIIVGGEGLRYEYEAASAVSPGDLIITNSASKVLRHATAGGATEPLFAIENEIFGKGVEVDYAATDRVLCEACHSGMLVNYNVAPAAPAIVVGDQLESAGDGTLRKKTTGVAIAVADEAVDNSAGGSKTRARARII